MTFKPYITIEMIIIKINIPPTVRITAYKASYYNIASRGKCRFVELTLKTVAMQVPAITLPTFDGDKIIGKIIHDWVWH